MEEVIKIILTVFIVLVPIFGKLVEKSLKSAGRTDMQKKVHDALEPLYEDDEDKDDAWREIESDVETVPDAVLEPVSESAPQLSVEQPAAELLEGGYRSIKDIIRERQSKNNASEQPGKKRLDIDPEKLVIYSEIMNPKF